MDDGEGRVKGRFGRKESREREFLIGKRQGKAMEEAKKGSKERETVKEGLETGKES